MTNCIDCEFHRVIPDPDPNDSFNYDDMAVVCTQADNPMFNKLSKHAADWQPCRCITVACRPYRIRKESDTPDWCPSITGKVPQYVIDDLLKLHGVDAAKEIARMLIQEANNEK